MKNLLHWDVIESNGNVHAVFEITEGCVYDPEITRLVGQPDELDSFCEGLLDKRWANQSVVDEFRSIVESRVTSVS